MYKDFPDGIFFFSPADIATQVLNFGLPAPITIQIAGPGRNNQKNYEIAQELMSKVTSVNGAVDVRLQQVRYTPDIRLNVDRTLASQIGTTQRDIASSLLISLSSSNQTAPNFWLNPETGINYSILVQTPQYKINSVEDLQSTPIIPVSNNMDIQSQQSQLLGNFATVSRGASASNVTHYNINPTYDIQLGVEGSDLGTVSDEIDKIVSTYNSKLPRGSSITLRGQVDSMRSSFSGLTYGLLFSVILVYFLMVVNFQSWLDPFIILMALPGSMVGIIWILFATGTSISVPGLMGAIMSIGVATANSILMVTFANDQLKIDDKKSSLTAAFEAGTTRLRPVIMTAFAMIVGMLPMALGLGEGAEQNAPLGRAVIGGLIFATFATLFLVPVVYSIMKKNER